MSISTGSSHCWILSHPMGTTGQWYTQCCAKAFSDSAPNCRIISTGNGVNQWYKSQAKSLRIPFPRVNEVANLLVGQILYGTSLFYGESPKNKQRSHFPGGTVTRSPSHTIMHEDPHMTFPQPDTANPLRNFAVDQATVPPWRSTCVSVCCEALPLVSPILWQDTFNRFLSNGT